METKKRNRRNRLLVNPPIQFAYWKLILTTMFLTALILFSCMYQFLDRLVLRNAQVTYVETQAVLEVFHQTSTFLFFAFPAITIALLVWSLLISNQIAGPIYRLEKELDRILTAGDFGQRVEVRKRDVSLQNLSNLINQLLDKIQPPSQKGSL